MKLKYFMLIILCLIGIAACGDNDDSTNVIVTPSDRPENQQEEQGPVAAGPTIKVNNRIENNVIVVNQTRIDGDDMHMNWRCQQAPPTVVHQQYIHISVRCPTLADDTNNDQVLDPFEIQQVVGPRVIALDSSLSNQDQTEFPAGDDYVYDQRIPLVTLRESVPQDQDFVVMVYGADPDTVLPSTYNPNSEEPIHLTVPIACQLIQAPATIPGSTTGATAGGTVGGSTTGGGTTTGSTVGGTTTGGARTGTTTGGTVGGSIGGTTGGVIGGIIGGTSGATTGGSP